MGKRKNARGSPRGGKEESTKIDGGQEEKMEIEKKKREEWTLPLNP